jgi:hypothetical protein
MREAKAWKELSAIDGWMELTDSTLTLRVCKSNNNNEYLEVKEGKSVSYGWHTFSKE